MNPDITAISRRQIAEDPNHHLWKSHDTWWLDCTIHLPDFTKWRLRKNLRTTDVRAARELRDRILMANPACPVACRILRNAEDVV